MSDHPQANFPLQSVFVTKGALNPVVRPEESEELAMTVARAASDRKAGDITILRVAAVSYLADYFVLVTGYSKVQVRAIAQAIEDEVEREWQRQPLRTEGQKEGTWVLEDYGDVIVHIMMPKERDFYNLEAFWGHAERIEFPAAQSMGER
jgi:ribosome-associated protein